MSSTRHYRVDYTSKSPRKTLRPSAVFAVRLPADLVDDLHGVCSQYHINRNALINFALSYMVLNHASVLGPLLDGLDDEGVLPLAIFPRSCGSEADNG